MLGQTFSFWMALLKSSPFPLKSSLIYKNLSFNEIAFDKSSMWECWNWEAKELSSFPSRSLSELGFGGGGGGGGGVDGLWLGFGFADRFRFSNRLRFCYRFFHFEVGQDVGNGLRFGFDNFDGNGLRGWLGNRLGLRFGLYHLDGFGPGFDFDDANRFRLGFGCDDLDGFGLRNRDRLCDANRLGFWSRFGSGVGALQHVEVGIAQQLQGQVALKRGDGKTIFSDKCQLMSDLR